MKTIKRFFGSTIAVPIISAVSIAFFVARAGWPYSDFHAKKAKH